MGVAHAVRGRRMAAAATSYSALLEGCVPRCTADPERWTTTQPDTQAVALCVACPRRGWCAQQAYQATNVQGLWAGVIIPESGQRARDFALRSSTKKRRGTKPSPGTLYPALKELRENGLITADKDKYYSLTKKGETELKSAGTIFCKIFYDMREMFNCCK